MEKKVVLITGSATGLGKRIVLDLASAGYDVAINYRSSQQEASQLVQQVRQECGIRAEAFQGDVSHPRQVQQLVDQVIIELGSVDILINTAGPFVFPYKKVVDYTEEEWQLMTNGNLSSVFYLCKRIIPIMRKRGWGRIINFGFNLVETAPAWVDRGPYAAAKVGLVSLTKTLALEEAPHGITVNMISPGDIVYPWKERLIGEVVDQPNDGTPVGRIGSGEDVSRIVKFLCDTKSDFITGAIIPVTGGKTSFV